MTKRRPSRVHRNFRLERDAHDILEALVEGGHYSTATDALCDALRVLAVIVDADRNGLLTSAPEKMRRAVQEVLQVAA